MPESARTGPSEPARAPRPATPVVEYPDSATTPSLPPGEAFRFTPPTERVEQKFEMRSWAPLPVSRAVRWAQIFGSSTRQISVARLHDGSFVRIRDHDLPQAEYDETMRRWQTFTGEAAEATARGIFPAPMPARADIETLWQGGRTYDVSRVEATELTAAGYGDCLKPPE